MINNKNFFDNYDWYVHTSSFIPESTSIEKLLTQAQADIVRLESEKAELERKNKILQAALIKLSTK